ncbi:MAG: TldD/PmbA family protein, partial [Nitrospirales bacterium]
MARTPSNARPLSVDSLDRIKREALAVVRDACRKSRHCRYADLRLDLTEYQSSRAESGVGKQARSDVQFGFQVRVLAGHPLYAPGYYGHRLGVADLPRLPRMLREGFAHAYSRAIANARLKEGARARFPRMGDSLADLSLAAIDVRQDTVKAEYGLDPRTVPLREVARLVTEVSEAVRGVGSRIRFNAISAWTGLTRELFASSEGSLIDQSFAETLGWCTVVADSDTADQALSDSIGHQRGWEVLTEGTRSQLI